MSKLPPGWYGCSPDESVTSSFSENFWICLLDNEGYLVMWMNSHSCSVGRATLSEKVTRVPTSEAKAVLFFQTANFSNKHEVRCWLRGKGVHCFD